MAGAIQSEIGGPGGRAGGERLAVVCNTGGSPERELTYSPCSSGSGPRPWC